MKNRNGVNARRGRLAAIFAVAMAAPIAGAQSTHLLNTDTGLIMPRDAWQISADGRFFGGKESNGYGGFRGYYGFGNGLDVTLKGAFGGRKTANGNGFGIRYGGSDIEAQVRYALPYGFTVAAGLAKADTPAQDDTFFTAGLTYRLPIREAGVYVGARGLYRDRYSLTALTLGAEYAFNLEWTLMGDLAVLVDGENTFSSKDGRQQKTATFGVGFRYTPRNSPDLSYTIGLTNAVGSTTGFGNSAAFGGTTGLFVGLTFKG